MASATYSQGELNNEPPEFPLQRACRQTARANTEGSFFCQGCGTCLEECSEAPDIPTLMRCYMYAYGYRDIASAVRNIKSVKDNPIQCAACSTCVVRCPMGFDVRAKVLDIIRLRESPAEFFG